VRDFTRKQFSIAYQSILDAIVYRIAYWEDEKFKKTASFPPTSYYV
jgi:hypothetical protein